MYYLIFFLFCDTWMLKPCKFKSRRQKVYFRYFGTISKKGKNNTVQMSIPYLTLRVLAYMSVCWLW